MSTTNPRPAKRHTKQIQQQYGSKVAKVFQVAISQEESTHAAIAAKAGVSSRTVKRYLGQLREAGWIKWEAGKHTNHYQAATALQGRPNGLPCEFPVGTTSRTGGGVDDDQPAVDHWSVISSLNQSIAAAIPKGSRPDSIFDPR